MTEKNAPAVRFPPPLLFLGLLFLGPVINKAWPLPPIGVSWLPGVAIGIVGLAIIAAAQFRFRATGENPVPWTPTNTVIDTGIFAITRNPMYLGMATAQFGFGVALDSFWSITLVPVSIWIITSQVIAKEEAYLTRARGQPYRDYCRRVPRWL